MDGYEIEKIDEGLWAIDDKMGCSMYLVEGKNKALLVDTGVKEGEILPMLKSLTDKPISLALTHAHIDHMYHADEFEEVFEVNFYNFILLVENTFPVFDENSKFFE